MARGSKYYIALENEYGAHNYHPIPVVISKAKGVWVWDPEGRKYLDCLASYSAVNQGHRHPKIIKALRDQANKVTLTSRAFHNDMLGPFLKKLTKVTQLEMALPMNTGAEAVETAVKIARKWGYEKKGVPKNKAQIIVCRDNFHGRTTTIVSFATDPVTRVGFGPFTPGFKVIPYNDIDALENAITDNTVGFLVEPIQAEAGVKVPSEGYMRAAGDVCRQHNVLFMLDEIQTGCCRTGKMFAWMHENAKPDVIMVGKALGGGVVPVSAAVSSRDIMSVIGPGEHGSTFGGNPLACAVGMASLDVLIEEKLDKRAEKLGRRFREGLHKIKTNKVKEIRGVGLLNAIEIKKSAGDARKYTERLKELGVLAKDTHGQTIRFAPPLVIEERELDWMLGAIEKVLA
ncbi:MAG: ornithine--oxo-acid transaminase [Candidatus Latescibacteria bacterium]|nr:ornithine--oxo-acid transaminase [Candidatus Latescibacterota bacterium]NIO56746.1 ornithine--oxo-acid transaminase [Candidatus Latescibacterota bacterium]NIT02331.1 ornithine--oxo-acid transaminase [Candidatus Latescibacterota bacterium]NIT39214.1 ornithine--oxo-acid transaminase [Candidatus Latescibacterota bacterium]